MITKKKLTRKANLGDFKWNKDICDSYHSAIVIWDFLKTGQSANLHKSQMIWIRNTESDAQILSQSMWIGHCLGLKTSNILRMFHRQRDLHTASTCSCQ